MAFRLKPTERGFYPLFSAAAENIAEAARLLAELVASEPAERGELAKQIKDLETHGDEVTHRILVKLNSTFVTPFDREDIHRLAACLDDVIDIIEEAADRIVLYRLGELPPGVGIQCELLCQAASATAEAMPKLAGLTQLHEYTVAVNSLEDDADGVYRGLLGQLLAPEDNEHPPDVLEILKIKEVVETLEDAADAFETVANTVESIVVKEA
jgi:predicted phosphate transport protein (TIGR00153 family)